MNEEVDTQIIPAIDLRKNKKIYFASDFHLGIPDRAESLDREKKIVRWLDTISLNAKAIFLLGDIFDFWWEYKQVIPKGFSRFFGKLAEIRDRDIPIYIFGGNHDFWMFNYFTEEFSIPIFSSPISFTVNKKKILVGHGDGLGPNDHFYKLLKKCFFKNPAAQWLFGWLHPDIGLPLGNFLSRSSRAKHQKYQTASREINPENEWIYQYCLETESKQHHEYYIFGHRHIPMEIPLNKQSTYFNLGEWIEGRTFLSIDNEGAKLQKLDHEE